MPKSRKKTNNHQQHTNYQTSYIFIASSLTIAFLAVLYQMQEGHHNPISSTFLDAEKKQTIKNLADNLLILDNKLKKIWIPIMSLT